MKSLNPEEDLQYQTSFKNGLHSESINKIYVSEKYKINPLIENKGSSQYSKSKKFLFENSSIDQYNMQNDVKRNNLDQIYIPSEEFKDSEPSLSTYSFGFSNDLFKKTMTEIKNKHSKAICANYSVPQTPLGSTPSPQKDYQFSTSHDFNFRYENFCKKYSKNYIKYALTIKKIYNQYLMVSTNNNEITRTLSFKDQTIKNESNKDQFKKNLLVYGDKKTLVLDLDETMIFASVEEIPNYSFQTVIGGGSESELSIYVKLRPFLHDFLKHMIKFYEIVVCTASEKEYADKILDFIEKDDKFFAHRLFKTHCIVKEDLYLFKNLNVLASNRSLKDIIIVDNSVRNFALFICNGIPINEFLGSDDDMELCKINNFLIQLSKEKDCSAIIKDGLVRFLIS